MLASLLWQSRKAFLHPVPFVSGSDSASTRGGDLTLIPFTVDLFPSDLSFDICNKWSSVELQVMLPHYMTASTSVVLRPRFGFI